MDLFLRASITLLWPIYREFLIVTNILILFLNVLLKYSLLIILVNLELQISNFFTRSKKIIGQELFTFLIGRMINLSLINGCCYFVIFKDVKI